MIIYTFTYDIIVSDDYIFTYDITVSDDYTFTYDITVSDDYTFTYDITVSDVYTFRKYRHYITVLFVRLIARGARIGRKHTHTHTHTHTQTDQVVSDVYTFTYDITVSDV